MNALELFKQALLGDRRALARAITLVENDLEGAENILHALDPKTFAPLIGITGPPGAGKSTIINSLISQLTSEGKTVAIIAVDPTSPFNFGSLLGDRLRMAEHFTNPNVFIRSLATRGSLGGLSAKSIEISDLVRACGFDLVIVETVGVGQSEVEIAGLADTTVVVLVPEGGDDVQAIKSGIMEIADIFVVNKSDRPGAAGFARNLNDLLHERPDSGWTIPVIKTAATQETGITELLESIRQHREIGLSNKRRINLYTEKAYTLIRNARMRDIRRADLQQAIDEDIKRNQFQLYQFIKQYLHKNG
ncbi:MAG: methylmalonyl Co-A mutase-associated GTPase MeaB [Bacteroidia bacterium]